VSRFADPERAAKAFERIARLTGDPALTVDDPLFEGCPDPDQALTTLERWLKASTNPATAWGHLLGSGPLARLLTGLLGASHQLGDVLVQNPERATLLLDPAALAERPSVAGARTEARRLLGEAHSYWHRLDRLRFVKQRWMLTIAGCDLARLWPEEDVWSALADVAEALVVEAAEVVWAHLGGAAPCPVAIVAMGKLGGRELNYSSDVDLLYVLPDEADADTEAKATRLCEVLGRAVSDRMGRGALYRVDLRLRPFGGTGPILNRFQAVQGYYERYAEPWELLALIRSRVLGGGPLTEEWEAMRQRLAFPEQIVEWAVEGLLVMREQVEVLAPEEDLKRGAGGIRDVEFLTQILQMLGGWAGPSLRVAGTLPAIRALAAAGTLPAEEAADLIRGYTLLRQVEHRVQIAGDRQTHSLPSSPAARDYLARSLGMTGAGELLERLDETRRRLRAIWDGRMRRVAGEDPAQRLDDALGRLAIPAKAWLESLGEPGAFARALLENADSLQRFERALRDAPALVPLLHQDLALSEQLLSGEIEEPEGFGVRLAAVERAGTTAELARAMARAWRGAALAWALGGGWPLGTELARVADATARTLLRLAEAPLDVIALGSWASGELSPGSDLDALLLAGAAGGRAEAGAERVLAHVAVARRGGAPLDLDLRLRPDGRKGPLVRSDGAFLAYASGAMESWERFALTQARLVTGRPEALALVHRAAFGGAADLAELRRMKRRIETERVPAQHLRRHVKLGWGGLDDIRWLVGVRLIRAAPPAPPEASLDARLAFLGSARELNAAEIAVVRDAHSFLVALRDWLWLLGMPDDVLPENPHKLDHLARVMGLEEGNALLARHREHAEGVRALLEDAWA
jgi:glutamate-ammonia-ligase adenylyltransferase